MNNIPTWVSVVTALGGGAILTKIVEKALSKKVDDLSLDDSKIRFLKEIQSFEEDKFRKMMSDYKILEANGIKMKELLAEQEKTIVRYKRRNTYLKNILEKNKIKYDPNDE